MPAPPDITCFHCGLTVPKGSGFAVDIDGETRPMCCKGCEAVAQAIVDNGLTDFYRHRTENAPTGQELVPEYLRQARAYDHPQVQKTFVHIEDENIREASLVLEGITCAACVWLNERHIAALPGVVDVQVNYATHRARVKWDNAQIELSQILEAVHNIGYIAHPYDPSHQERLIENERRSHLKRLGTAAVLGMQVMILAVAMYAGDWYGMEPEFRSFFSWISLALTLPILFYSAAPFFRAAWRDLSHWQTGMDVPVSLGIGIAFAGSAWATWQGTGHVYYDSVAMFVFFLLSARYFELVARKRAAEAGQSLVHAVPAVAIRLIGDGNETEESVTVAELKPGDRVLIPPGDTVPADGIILEGRSSVDESLLTGESRPISKCTDDNIIGGSINIESPLIIRISKTDEDTVLASILRLLDRAQTEKPAMSRLADRTASWFVLGVLILAIGVAFYWWQHDPQHWLAIVVSVLVVTCPCALSLATPTALTAATGGLTRLGLLATRGHALETLARATQFVFDKTGTLTEGKLRLRETSVMGNYAEDELLAKAAALESRSEHPIARAICSAVSSRQTPTAANVHNSPGAGIEGTIQDSRWLIGSVAFVEQAISSIIDPAIVHSLQADGRTVVWLANSDAVQAAFVLGDEIREGAHDLVAQLESAGTRVLLLTGDHQQAARKVADQLNIKRFAAEQTPDSKLAQVQKLQQGGEVVAMVGDGVNDAPVLAGAHLSIAMGSSAQIAAASADMLLLSQKLPHLVTAVHVARKTMRIVRQNLAWAVMYNIVALPLAAMGYVAPWMAAIGMSASSLLVVTNALRLTRKDNYSGTD
jgi:Cu2+-exporting ATPase